MYIAGYTIPKHSTPTLGDSNSILSMSWVGESIDRANGDMRAIVEALGGVWGGWLNRGVYSSGDGSSPGGGSPLPGPGATVVPGGGSGSSTAGRGVPADSVLPRVCGGMVLGPVPSVYVPVVPVPPAPPAPRVPMASVAPAPVVPVVPVDDPPECAVTPENICSAALRGCFRAGQVDQEQLRLCAAVGWRGNYNNYPWLVARGGANKGAMVPVINRNPSGPRGLSGLDPMQAGGNGAMLIGALLIGGALYMAKKGGTR